MTLHATYRLQFHRDFTFADAERLADYFATVGVSHIYSSPILAARAGSRHGYDVVDPARVNTELGGESAFRSMVAAFRERGVGILLDIVPNHMAVGGADNPYWLDVLEKGRRSVFANLFDIDWDPDAEASEDKVIVPMLGKPLASCISDGDIALLWEPRLGKFVFSYGDTQFPIRLDDYDSVIGSAGDAPSADVSRYRRRGDLAALLARQHYKLVYWRDAGRRINWRRFFDITDLAAVRVEDDTVFEATHATILRLYGEGLIDGVRVDHVDGLADPAAYCRRLRARLEALTPQRPTDLAREPAIIFVEKILAVDETLPMDWGVDGTTGYDFMHAVSGLQHDPAAAPAFTELWTSSSERPATFECEEQRARSEMLDNAFANALRITGDAFAVLDDSDTPNKGAYERALRASIDMFRAYRTYALGDTADPKPGVQFETAIVAAQETLRSDPDALNALDSVANAIRGKSAELGDAARDAVRRFNQLAAPVAAKAVEDTAFYRYGRLLSRNDVGFSPGHFALSPDFMHNQNAARVQCFPRALVTTATHDHKRGEDARARLAVLSEVPDAWQSEQQEWFAINDTIRPDDVSRGDEYQLYQTLIGALPLDLSMVDPGAVESFTERILSWREKSLREAKLETSWAEPNEAVEGAHREFVKRLLSPSHPFLARLANFVRWLAPAGALNSLVSCALRYMSPGVPDLYQGTELWDFSLVDPDNRRSVDFDHRARALQETSTSERLLHDWKDGRIKLDLIRRLLSLRHEMPDLFLKGAYHAVEVRDSRVFCFTRTLGARTLLVAVPRLCAAGAIAHDLPLPSPELGALASMSVLEQGFGANWRNCLDAEGRSATMTADTNLFASLPVAVLLFE